jgi:hypothetical protein
LNRYRLVESILEQQEHQVQREGVMTGSWRPCWSSRSFRSGGGGGVNDRLMEAMLEQREKLAPGSGGGEINDRLAEAMPEQR